MNERDFLDLARLLLTNHTEAAWRSAVSRAYYAAFHVARQLLASMNFRIPRADRAHAHLWLRLANSGDPAVVGTGNDLNRLRSYRNAADYDLGLPLRQQPAHVRVQLADQIILALDRAAVEPLRTQVRDEMIRYERDVLRDVTWQP